MKPVVFSVIIPVFNNFNMTRNCLESLKMHAPDVEMEIIVADNGSSDETATELQTLGERLFAEAFRCIRFDENRNFGPACNAGAREARGEYLFFLNNDTLLTPDWFPPLAAGLDQESGATGPLLMYPQKVMYACDRIQHLGVCCEPQLQLCHLYEYFPASHPAVDRKRSLQFLTGAALFMRRSVFFEVGMFHEGYMNGGEDLDLCVQLRRKGYTLSLSPESRIFHLQSQTPGRHDHETENAALFKKRCMQYIFPDLHLHLKTDGYELALTKHLIPYARLPRRRRILIEKAFSKATPTPDAEACLSMLIREPLFSPAYERLAAIHEEENDPDALTRLRFLQTKLFPSHAAGFKLREAAQKSGNTLMDQEGERLVAMTTLPENESTLFDTAREMVKLGEQLRQPVLAALYSGWLNARKAR